jgi:TRAP-type C4-dicarboxylate transport system substrate-binding protein
MMIVMNNDTYKKLSPSQQKALDQAAKEASRFNDQLLKSINADIEKQLFAKMKVTKINNAPWREATKDVYKSFLKYDGFGDLYLGIRQVGEKY